MASLTAIEEILAMLQVVPGLKVSKDKSLMYHIPLGFANFSKFNFKKVDSLVNLKSWNDKNLYWFERIQIVNTMIFPKYLFLFWVALLQITLKASSQLADNAPEIRLTI